jgi:hypothetical protein
MSNATINATVILNHEINMLDQLAAMIETFTQGYQPSPGDDDFDFKNLKCWAKELKGYRDIDQQYAGMPAPDLRSALQEEIDVLQGCLNSITSKSAAGQYWADFLSENIYYTGGTLSRVK